MNDRECTRQEMMCHLIVLIYAYDCYLRRSISSCCFLAQEPIKMRLIGKFADQRITIHSAPTWKMSDPDKSLTMSPPFMNPEAFSKALIVAVCP